LLCGAKLGNDHVESRLSLVDVASLNGHIPS
jgi:hypothetical protein